MTEQPERKPMGRPRLPDDQAKLHALGLRTTRDNYETVNQWARASGRSVAQEIERAIQFRRGYEELFEGNMRKPNLAMIATFEHAGKAKARSLPESERHAWLADKTCFRAAVAETVMALLEVGPEGLSPESARAVYELIVRRLVVTRAANAAGEPLTPEAEARDREACETLAALAEQEAAEPTPAPQPTRQRRRARGDPPAEAPAEVEAEIPVMKASDED